MITAATVLCVYQVFDYHLSGDSKNIDAGMDAGVNKDTDADPRFPGDGFDIGIDEYLDFKIHE